MIRAYVRRGLAAGLVAGLLAGAFAFVAGEPSIEDAIAVEEAAAADHGHDAAHAGDSGLQISRPVQRAGLILGTGLVGVAAGLLFALAAAWAVGRVEGDAWQRSLKLGAVAVGALVLLPALKYPPNPPAVGDPDTVGARTLAFLALGLCGLLLAAAGWSGARVLRARVASAPVRQVAVAAGVLAVAAVLLVVLPSFAGAVDFPPELLWRFRVAAVGTQALLYASLAACFGLLSVRAERRPAVRA